MVRETRHLWVSNQPEIVREERIRDHFKRSSEDVSPQSFEQRGSTYYDRSTRLVSEPDQYIRRSSNFHSNDLRGRPRERVYRNGPCPYPAITTDRSLSHHRVSSWYDTSSSSISSISGQGSSPATRSVYGSVASAVVQPDTSLYDCQLLKNKNNNKKSRSGSESPCAGSGSVNATSSHSSSHIVDRGNGGSAASSRSHSRSPSSCSSTNSTSSNSHASSPVSGSDPPMSSTSSTASRSRNLQSAVATAPNQSGNLVVHSEDNRPLAICVRNLPARSSDTSLKDGLFHEYKKHGKVTWVKVVGQNAERYALVCFKKPEDVEKALEVSQDKLFFGCKIEVEPYQGYDVEDNEFRPYEAELDEYHPKSTRTLFIGNLEKDITGSDIRNHFECFGEIIEIDIKKQGMNAYAFCQYSDIVSVVKAMRKMDGEHLGNNRIKLGFGKSMPTNCVWIDGIADSVSENYLMQQFKSYGPITEVVIDRERKLALISFEQVQYAQLAVKEMRGATLRNRKLQLDFASRECRDKFCSKVEKQTAGPRFSRYGSSSSGSGGASGTADSTVVASQSRSRASSFSRHNNLNSVSGSVGGGSPPAGGSSSIPGGSSSSTITTAVPASATATTSAASAALVGPSTATAISIGASGSNNVAAAVAVAAGSSTPRGTRSRGLRHSDYEYGEQRLRSYDEYSQGSGASHDDDSYNYANNCLRSDSPQSRLGTNTLDTLEVSSTSSGRRRCDKSPGDIRNLQKERFQILEQLEECPSSGDELVSPKKRMKFDHSSHHHNHHHTMSSLTQSTQPSTQSQPPSATTTTTTTAAIAATTTMPQDCSSASSSNNTSNSLQPTNMLIGDSNCDVFSNHSNDANSSLLHRKCVEVRRLSECSSLKYASQLSSASMSSSSRRPSTEISGVAAIVAAGSVAAAVAANSFPSSAAALRHSNSAGSIGTETGPYVAPHSLPCKRRRTGASISSNSSIGGSTTLSNSTNDSNEHHSSRGRGHQLHSHHSHEASGGESADGSRPGTPLCDERPEVSLAEPRRIPRDRPHEPMWLPLPKFGIQFFQQHRAAAAANVSGSHGQSSTSGPSSHTGQMYSSINSSSSLAGCPSSSTNISSSSLLNNTSSSSMLLNSSSSHSSLSNTLSSPPPLTGNRLTTSASSFHHHHHHHSAGSSSNNTMHHHHHHHQLQQQQPHHHHHQQHHTNYHHSLSVGGSGNGEQPPASPLRPRSLSSNSSDSDAAPLSTSPSIEERLKTLDEMYELWSGGGASMSRPHAPLSTDTSHSAPLTAHSRHKFLELDVNEVKPSEFAKRVLAKKSIFDDDLQRLKNISDKYEPGDFTNLTRSSLVSTSPGIPNLAATKTPVVGGNPTKQAQQQSVFHSPSVNSLQRLNSPMNSPQAMSPYNSPSPSPVVTVGVAKAANTQQSTVPVQPGKGLQYPFPSHPPVVMTPTTPPAPSQATSQSKPKIATATKSYSLQEKPVTQSSSQPTTPTSVGPPSVTNRILCKSASVPGSTNFGTVKTATSTTVPLPNSLPANNAKSDENPDSSSANSTSSRRGSVDSSSGRASNAHPKSTANPSKKAEKLNKQNSRNDSDKKTSKSEKSRSESIDKRKTSYSEDRDDGNEHAENSKSSADEDRSKKADAEKNEPSEKSVKSKSDRESRKEKRREREEKEREVSEQEAEDRERREEHDLKGKEEKERAERDERERREQEEKREQEERARLEELARRERAEREESERREREEREELDRREREERERKEKEDRERREREEAARRDREECMRREREERERKEKEEAAARRDREERERREREESMRREREEREENLRREREDRERREREERERREKEREERERREKEKEERERREREEREHHEAEEREKREREELQLREEREHHQPDLKEHEDRSERNDRKERDEFDRKERKDREERRAEHKNNAQKDYKDRGDFDDATGKTNETDYRSKEEDYAHFRQLHHHHIDNNENHSLIEEHATNQKRRTSANSPIRMAKRRLSSQESLGNEENPKRPKINSSENRKQLDRFDSKDSTRASSKHHKSHNRASSLTKNSEDKFLSAADERCRKDSGFEEKKSKDKEHNKKYEKTSHRHKKSNTTSIADKDEHEIRSPTEKSSIFDLHDLRSSDDDHLLLQQQRHRNKKEPKEKKRHDHDEEPHRRSSDAKRHDRKSAGRSEDGNPKSDKSRGGKPPSRKMTQSSNDSDSDEPKKHSIFDIHDDGPYVSMYDKVKARSCKNMQKQEEEKKIKAKFSQLKQSRAKREEKKRSTSYDGDSDSDFDERHTKYKRSGFINSSSDEESSITTRVKDTPISDSDSDVRRVQYNRARLNELCDGDSSEGGGSLRAKHIPCKKISSKRNSRSTRIVSDSSDTESPNRGVKLESHGENMPNDDDNDNNAVKVEVKKEDEDVDRKMKINRFGADIKTEKDELSDKSYAVKMEIKEEPGDEIYNSSQISESEAINCSGSAVESKDSVLGQLFSPDVRKKHKKSKKRQKTASSHQSEIENDIKDEKRSPMSLEHVFDELKRESIAQANAATTLVGTQHFSEKKKHKDRKEKKRDKSREDYEKLSKEERHRLKKSKKSSKMSAERYAQETGSLAISKRSGEKMEDIFGPISDDETQLPMHEPNTKDSNLLYSSLSSSHTLQPVVSAALNPYKQEPLTPKSHSVEENEENKQKSNSHAERERHRKEKREKKRKERERNREQHALAAFQQKHEDENSVDLDEAGRALEAQLMEDSDNKLTDETTPSTATTHRSDMPDVFRFSDGDENSMEIASQEKREHSDSHKSKEKKKKKKRSKEERHQKRDHHHHSSTHNNNVPSILQAASDKLSIEITTPNDSLDDGKTGEELCKPSPSLPCLLDDSPPRKNNTSSDMNLSISPLVRDQPSMISPIPKTPTIASAATATTITATTTTATTTTKPSIECKKKPADKFIPGFDVELDEKISESAVKSISTEFTSPKILESPPPVIDEAKLAMVENSLEKSADKIEEKSRAVISQEETEDAVAALLGESFGTTNVDYSFADDPCDLQPEEDVVIQDPVESVIPEEEAEEMRKAVQSLSNEDIDIKPDTPQSEQDLQIDTDTEEPDEDKAEAVATKSQDDLAGRPPVVPKAIEATKPDSNDSKLPSNTGSVITASPKEVKPIESPKLPDTKATAPNEADKSEPEKTIDRAVPQMVFSPMPQRNSQSPVQPATIPVSPKVPAVSRPQSQFVTMQPPTISIPEPSSFVYPPVNVLLSPRGHNEVRMPSPRQVQQGPQTSNQFVNVRVSSPQSASMRPSQPATAIRHPGQLSPIVPTHMVIQQRQLMSPPGVTSAANQQQSASSANLTLNRLPVTSVLAPISKPIQQTNIVLPQPKTAQSSIISRSDSTGDGKDAKAVLTPSTVYQGMRVGTPTSTVPVSGSPLPQSSSVLHTGGQQPTIKTVIDSHGSPGHIQQIVPIQMQPGKAPLTHQTVVLQPQSPQVKPAQHMQPIPGPRGPPQSPQMQQQMAKIAQQQQLLQQHHLMQQRQHQMQLQQQQKQMQQQHAQMLQIQKQQHHPSTPPPKPNQQHPLPTTPNRIVQQQQQVYQVHPLHQQQPTQPQGAQQPLVKDAAHKITVSMQPQLVQNSAPGKDIQQTVGTARVQQNVVVVRQQAPLMPQQLAKPMQSGQVQSQPTQVQPHLQQQSQPVILQQRQSPLSSSQSSPLIFQQKVVPQAQSQPAGLQNIVQASSVKVPIPTSTQETICQSTQPTSATALPVLVGAKPMDDQTQKNAAETAYKTSDVKDPKESVIGAQSPAKRESSPKEREPVTPVLEIKKDSKLEAKSGSPQQELENVSVIKSQTAATPVQPALSSHLSEENVSKFSVPIDDHLEQDSKDDWSAKELNLNIESVIKKVDALCSTEEDTIREKPSEKSIEAKDESIKEVPKPITDTKEMSEKTPVDVPSVEPIVKSDQSETGNLTEPEKSEDTHDEEEFDETIETGKPGRGGKRANRAGRGGKKMPGHGQQQSANVASPPSATEGVQTRRGKSAQTSGSTRGRKGRGGQSRSPAASAVATPGEKKARNQSSDQDVYEFHEDSGEENNSAKADRPRLILTIKNQANAPVVQTKTASIAPVQQPATGTVAPQSSAASLAQPQLPPPQSAAAEATTPPQKDQKDRDEFTTPAPNTRKSRRLLEKDGVGGRNTVDDTIEDVVRNLSSPKAASGGQTPPRRSTRNSAQTTAAPRTQPAQSAAIEKLAAPILADARKSPRANRRSKDRKISETSVDSSDEKPHVEPDKSLMKQPAAVEVDTVHEKVIAVESAAENKEKIAAPPVIEKSVEKPATKSQDGSDTLALIDPVTGLLVVQQCTEGQYVPVPGAPAAPPNAKIVGKTIAQSPKIDSKLEELAKPSLPEPKSTPPPPTIEAQRVVVTTAQMPVVSTPSPISTKPRTPTPVTQIVVQPPSQKVQVHVQPQSVTVQASAPKTQETVPHGPLQPAQTHQQQPQPPIMSLQQPHLPVQQQIPMQIQQPQQIPHPQGVQPQTPISQQQQQHMQPQPQPLPIRTHPFKAYMLNSQHHTAMNKPIVSQSIVKVAAGGIVSQPVTTVVTNPNVTKPQQSAIVQSKIVTRHVTQLPSSGPPPQLPPQAQSHPSINLGPMPQQPGVPQPGHNLYVNIPPSSASAVQVAVAHSPRIQQTVMTKSADQSQPQPQQPIQLVQVVTKPMSGGQPQQIIAQHQPVVIHSNKVPPPQSQYATVVQGGKIIQQSVPIQQGLPGKPQTIQVAMPPHLHQQQQQQAPLSSQQPQQMQHVQKQSPTVSVVTHQLGKQIPLQVQQQHPGAPSHIIQQQQPPSHHVTVGGKPSSVPPNAIHLVPGQQTGIVLGSQHIATHAHQSALSHQSTGAAILQAKPAHQQPVQTPSKGVIGLHQAAQIMTGAVPSPPLKQSHLPSQQQPIVTGASSLRASVPPISPQGQARSHMLQPGLPAPAFDANMHDIGGYGAQLSQSPPPAHQQASPVTPGDAAFAAGTIRGIPRDHYSMYQQYYRTQPEARIPYIPRSPMVQGSGAEQKDLQEVDDAIVASPPLELRRPASGPRTIAVPHSLQSPQDRATDSPQVAQVYLQTRIPHPHYQDIVTRYYEPVRQVTAEPPPAHRPAHSVVGGPSPSGYAAQPSPGPPANLAHLHPKMMEREREREQLEREQREREQRDSEARYYIDDGRGGDHLPRKRDADRAAIPSGHTGMPSHDSLVPAMSAPTGRSIQVATPPHASQVPPQADSLLKLLQRYPVMWQGLLALKTDQAAVQMHFVFGNPNVARGSLPCNSDGSTPPLRIAQRMRLEQTQLEGVAKKMQYENEHCMLLALPCGRNHMDVLQQSRNLQTGFITYLQQKMAAGIVNIPVPGSDQAAYVVHIFPSCDFANDNLERAAPDLKHRVAEIAHLLIIIATV